VGAAAERAGARTVAEARAVQEALRSSVVARDAFPRRVRFVAGTDVSFARAAPTLFAAVVVLDARTLAVVDAASAEAPATFPYVPGYLSFRELPPLLSAFAKLRVAPDLVLCDGHGRAHPRRFGLASHLGVALDLPSIGCAKAVLVGEHAVPGRERGAFTPLRDGGATIGSVLRTRDGVAPVFVSVGHRVSLATARRLVLRLAPTHRLCEPIRAAHAECNRIRRAAAGSGGGQSPLDPAHPAAEPGPRRSEADCDARGVRDHVARVGHAAEARRGLRALDGRAQGEEPPRDERPARTRRERGEPEREQREGECVLDGVVEADGR
jgi:deoxyribonuclease V